MKQTAIGLALLVVLATGGVGACSSDSTTKGNSGGTGGTGGTGVPSNTGGSTSGSPTAGSATAGSSSGSGGSGGSGGSVASCAGKVNMCLDEQTLQACNPDTGMDVVINCGEDLPAGITNEGCMVAPSGDGEACLIDFEDQDCWIGANVVAYCFQADDEMLFNAYLNCYNDASGAREIITCFAGHAPADDTSAPDCTAAEACLPVGGAGPDGGAGAGPDAGGAGGAGN